MGIFRFSNAVSDIDKFVNTYRALYEHFSPLTEKGEYFDNTMAGEFLALNGLASSLGAVGQEAVQRSTRDDKSRDPLYNQHKSYSEFFRMLGWYEPGSQQTNYKLSEFGEYIAEASNDMLKKLLGLNILHIVSPNPLTNVKGGNVLRPFPLILKLMNNLDGLICRDEIIWFVLGCDNDLNENYLKDSILKIRNLRQLGKSDFDLEYNEFVSDNGVQANTLSNYTRMPIAVLKWLGWADTVSYPLFGDRKITTLKITDIGRSVCKQIEDSIDIRYSMLEHFNEFEIASFCVWMNLFQLNHIGYNIEPYENAMIQLKLNADNIFSSFNITDSTNILFFPYQEAPRNILQKGDEILLSL